MNESKEPLLIISGPTAVGKTELSIRLARELDGEIISADSVQVYRGMDIGSAKIRPEEMQGVPHHLIDCLDPGEEFHVQAFQSMVKEAIAGIRERGHLPILVGGTGFYIQAVIKDVDFTDMPDDTDYQASLWALGEREGKEALHRLLEDVDPESAASIPAGNEKRIIRALEYYHLTGERFSVHNAGQRQKEPAYNTAYFVLTDDRDVVYERINRRVDLMMEEGLLQEVQKLKSAGIPATATSMQALGYKELYDYLEGRQSLEEAIDLIKQRTRHFAKRQLTWFRREADVIWIDKRDFDHDNDKIVTFMKRKAEELGLLR
ncbi:MAG: tRNA (adenosine(37)-N6)-dimethylallyltransferase MiaA [Lachnospiraceae bacterium]|nr:tRNA (adenosine(37)-N6)-dimethylallyltransferase MiaA [Lachnospiraceae bacterium]